MKTIITILKRIDVILTKWLENYIYKVSRTLYPKPYLLENEDEDDEDNDPALFI